MPTGAPGALVPQGIIPPMRVRSVVVWSTTIIVGCVKPASTTSATPVQAPAHTPTATAPLTPSEPVVDAPDDASLLAPGVISTRHYELNAAETPDGQTLFFTVSSPQRSFNDYTIMMSHKQDGAWGPPSVAPFSGTYGDADPLVTADGKRVYFISTRPTPDDPEGRDFDIWYVERSDAGFGEPVNLGAPINTGADEFYVSLTTSGTVYFSTFRKGGIGSMDIFRSELRDGVYQTPQPLPEAVNSPGPEFDPYVAPDESFLIFASLRADSLGSADLYISFNQEGTWTKAINLGPQINSEAFEFCPIVSPDGRRFYYTSEKRRGDSKAGRSDYTSVMDHFDRVDNGLGNVYQLPISALPARPTK